MIKSPLNLAMLGDPNAEQYCEILGLAETFSPLTDPGCVGALPPDYSYFGFDPDTFELSSLLTTDRAAVINVSDADGVYVEIPGGQVAYPGSRVVKNHCRYSEDYTNSAWTKSSGTTVDATGLTIDGVTDVSQITFTQNSSQLFQTAGIISGERYATQLKIRAVSGEITLVPYTAGQALTLIVIGEEWSTVYLDVVANATGARAFGLRHLNTGGVPDWGSVYIKYIQATHLTGSQIDYPAEYVKTTTAVKVQQFANTNGNTVVDNIVTEAAGALLNPAPYALVAPEATNYFLNSQAPVTQAVAGRNGVHTVSVIGTGSVTLSGGLTGVVSDGSPVTGDPSGVTVTCTVSGAPDNVQFEDSPYVTQPIYTTTVPVLRDKDEVILDNANLNADEGSIYFELLAGQDTANLIDGFLSLTSGVVEADDGTNQASSAAVVVVGSTSKIGMVWGPSGMEQCTDGVWSILESYDGSLNDGVLDLFRNATASNQIRDLRIWDTAEKAEIDALMGA